ncbi:MAG: hypothetical protein FJ267_05870, partial [Planctomycetes bacterium]|nr:hypothetical protein [Planctomycetota bacterium]
KRVEVIESELPADEIVGKLRLASFNDAERRRCQVQWREITQRFENLSDKEQEVLNFLKEGFANKSIAGQIQISERAVEMRRASVMRKLKVGSHAGLIRMATLYDVYRNYGLPLPTE